MSSTPRPRRPNSPLATLDRVQTQASIALSLIVLGAVAVVGLTAWLSVVTATMPNGKGKRRRLCGLKDVECVDPVEEGGIVAWNGTSETWMSSTIPDVETCNCSTLTVEDFQFPASTDPPCNCSDPDCAPNRIWFCSEYGQFFYCDNASDTWLHVGPPHSLWGEQSRNCNFGNNPVNDAGCAMALGARALPASGGPEYGLYIYRDFTIVSWGSSIDDQSECTSGSYDVMVCWTPGPLQDDAYDLANCTRIGINQTSDAANDMGLRIDIPGDRYVIWGLENNCNGGGSINGMNIHLNIKYRV